MSKRTTYRPSELRAGKTIWIVTVVHAPMGRVYDVAQHLIAGKREPQPEPGMVHPYRMHPEMARYAESVTLLFRTRRAALKEAHRRQRAA